MICFDGEAKELKGFENLSVTFRMGVTETFDGIDGMETAALEPVSLRYPPQIWGEYENGGLRMEIQPKYNDRITVETPENDENGVLFSVSETASQEDGDFDGAGWLFSVCRISEEKLHELLGGDMSGIEVFAKDEEGNRYLYRHPTDVSYARSTTEEMQRDAAIWSMLCEWAGSMKEKLSEANGLENESFDNSYMAMLIARAAWDKNEKSYLATTEFMDVDAKAADGTPYAEYVLRSGFGVIGSEELPNEDYLTGENLVLGFPDEDVYLHFYPVDDGYIILDNGEDETIYQVWRNDGDLGIFDVMQGWYYAAAEKSGVKPADESLGPFLGAWHEKTAGRGAMTIAPSPAPGKAKIEAVWPGSAAVQNTWTMTASLTEDGKLVYENGTFESVETDENGESWTVDSDMGAAGELSFEHAGELCWYDSHAEGDGISVFVR